MDGLRRRLSDAPERVKEPDTEKSPREDEEGDTKKINGPAWNHAPRSEEFERWKIIEATIRAAQARCGRAGLVRRRNTLPKQPMGRSLNSSRDL